MANPWDADPIVTPAAKTAVNPWDNDPIVSSAETSPAMTTIGGDNPGMLSQGNIDLAKRPKVKNSDGSISTVRSMSFNEDGREILVPTVSPDGRLLSDDEAIDLYRKTGQSLGAFDTPENATRYAERLHQQQEGMYAAPEQDKSFTGSILPVSRDAEGNVSFDSNAGIVGAVKRAFMLPGDVMAGEVDPLSEQGISRAADFAAVFGPTSPAIGTGAAIAANAPRIERPGMEVAAAADRLGVPVPRAATSDSASVQQTGKILSNVPIGGTPLRVSSQRAIDELGNAATKVEKGFGSGSAPAAGAAAREGITEFASKTLPGRVKAAYDNVDSLITQNVVSPLSETAKVAADITAKRTNAALPESGAVRTIQNALNQKDGLNYQGIKDLRTAVGEMLDSPQGITASGMSEAELRRIYGGLTADLKSAVARSGGEKASAAFEAANQLAARTAREREGLQRVLGRDASDERIFDRITSMAGSNARADRVSLARVRSAVSGETWNELASGVISNLGRAPDGGFSPDRFVSGWGKLSAEGKAALFGGKKELATALDDIATVSTRFKQLNQYANPSGTGQTVLGGALGSGLIADPITAVSSTVGARVLSTVLAKPTSARALAAYSKAYERQITSPSKMNSQALTNTARAVAALLANEAGNKGLAAQIFPAISGVKRLPAQDGSENNGLQENQSYGAAQQLPVLLPNEI